MWVREGGGKEGRQNWRYSVLWYDWDADANKCWLYPCMPQCCSFLIFSSPSSISRCLAALSACTARKCWELDWKWSLWYPWWITQGSAGTGGTEWFHSSSDEKSHVKYGSLWGNHPRKHLFIRKFQANVGALTTLMNREVPQEENVIGRRRISIRALGRGCRYGTERQGYSNFTDLDSTGRNSFYQWNLELIGKE